MPNPFLTASNDPERLAAGVVYRRPVAPGSPATHVLIVGVGDYQDKTSFPQELKTATRSARALADWFIDETPNFKNASCPLASVAMVLSKSPSSTLAQYAGGPVPRAIFGDLENAALAWLHRINAHPGNLAILYVAAHGVSFERRSAFLLEEFGTRAGVATFGMVEVEQLITALDNAIPTKQLLLFDCCRDNVGLNLPANERLGDSVLIPLVRAPGDHGLTRRQWAITAAALGQSAYGEASGRTLFNNALLDALDGVASDPADPDWPVRPSSLHQKIDRILQLYKLPAGHDQVPTSQAVGSFDFTYPGAPSDHPVYVSLANKAQWPSATISITANSQPVVPDISGGPGHKPFAVRRFPTSASLNFVATVNGTAIGKTTSNVVPPALFVEIGGGSGAHVLSQATPAARAGGAGGLLDISAMLNAGLQTSGVAIAKVAGSGPTSRSELAIEPNIVTEFARLAKGHYEVELRRPDGRIVSQGIEIDENTLTTILFPLAEPSEDMALAGEDWALWPAIVGELASLGAAEPEPSREVWVDAVGVVNVELRYADLSEPVRIRKTHSSRRFDRFDVHDSVDRRFDVLSVPPLFARVRAMPGRMEYAVIPSVGSNGAKVRGRWMPYLITDASAVASERMTSVGIDGLKWVGLFGFLGVRDFASGNVLLDSGLEQSATVAYEDDEVARNPFPALAAALVAVGSGEAARTEKWLPLMARMSEAHWALPDAPIILGRHRLMRAKSAGDLEAALAHFEEGYARGVPYFSLSVDWLSRGLNSIGENSEGHRDRQMVARRLASRVDPTTAFTVVRMS